MVASYESVFGRIIGTGLTLSSFEWLLSGVLWGREMDETFLLHYMMERDIIYLRRLDLFIIAIGNNESRGKTCVLTFDYPMVVAT